MPSTVPTQDEFESELTAIAQAVAAGKAELHDRIDRVREGLVVAIDKALKDSGSALMDLLEAMERIEKLEAKVFPAPEPPPPPDPEQEQPPPVSGAWNLKLVGALRIDEAWPRYGLAIDWEKGEFWTAAASSKRAINRYPLVEFGDPSNIATCPRVAEIETVSTEAWRRFPPGQHDTTYCNSLAIIDGEIVGTTRYFYASDKTTLLPYTDIRKPDGTEVLRVPVPNQQYGGFVKGVGSLEVGGGGYESGSQSAWGPTLAKLNGTKHIAYDYDISYEKRCKRPGNFWVTEGEAQWLAICQPRFSDGVIVPRGDAAMDERNVGAWLGDRIWGHGIRHSTGIYYWATMSVGEVRYDWIEPPGSGNKIQFPNFSKARQIWMYRFHPETYELLGWSPWSEVMPNGVASRDVIGSDISPDGKHIYLLTRSMWSPSGEMAYPAILKYEVQ